VANEILRGVEKTVRTKYDKSSWGAGPWQSEPDEYRWSDSVTGIRCLLYRTAPEAGGVWCGHCGLPGNHPWERLDKDKIPVGVHGGITHKGIVLGDGGGMTWIGFDCAGPGDLQPGLVGVARSPRLIYRDQRFATTHVLRLAVEIVLATGPGAWWEDRRR
jgi:hypothetical protein